MADVKSIKGTQTEKNLAISYLNEAQSYARYTYYANQANKELYFPIGVVFNVTAANELRHGKIFLGFLQGGSVIAPTPVDALPPSGTIENLKISISEEQNEGVDAYIKYAQIAEQEGFTDIASKFRAIAKIEQEHLNRFRRLLQQVETGTVWKRDKPILWQCLVCGYQVEALEPPKVCPACSHPYQHYMATDILL